MKILAITHQLDRSGAPTVLLDFLKILMGAGYEVDLISMKDGDLRDDVEGCKIPVKIQDKFLKNLGEFTAKAAGYNLVICNTLATFDAIYALKNTDIPVLWWIHENRSIFEFLKDLLPDFNSLPENIHVFTASPQINISLKEFFGFEAPVLPFYVENTNGEFNKKAKDSKTRFLTVGSYSKIKGQDILIKAIDLLPKDVFDKCEFLFCGNDKTYDEEVYNYVKDACNKHDNIKMLGSLLRQDVFELMNEVDCVVIPSREETMSAVAIEAMMNGAVCLCSDRCGISYYLQDEKNGFVVRGEDEKQLAQRIEDIANNRDLYKDIASAGQEVYKADFSVEVFKRRALTIVENLINKNGLILFVGVYDILDIFMYRFSDSFKAMGYRIFLFNAKKTQESLSTLSPFIKNPVKAALTLNNLGFNMELREGSIIWDDLGIPMINFLMDHPFCYKEALDNSPKAGIVLSPDMNHANYTQRFFPNIPVNGFLGHAGIEVLGQKKKLKDRKYDVIYTGGISSAFAQQITPDWNKYDFEAKRLCDEALEELIRNPHRTTEEVIEEGLINMGIRVDDATLSQYITDFHMVDLYAVSHFREKVIETIAKAGINIELYGFGWEICDWINLPNVHFGGRIPAEEVPAKMLESKIVLSTMTWFKEGTHDRVFNGMLAGAVTMSDESGYMIREFRGEIEPNGSDNREMVLFNLKEIDKVPDMIKDILSNLDNAQAIADRGYAKAKKYHTWDNRAWEIEEGILKEL